MAGVQQVQIDIGQIPQIGGRSFYRKEDVAFTPDDERGWLLRAEKFLPLWIERDIGAVVVKEIELDQVGVGPCQEVQVHVPGVGTDLSRIAVSMQVNALHAIRLQECL